MNPVIELRILCFLRARYFQHEVASIIGLEYPHLDEFDLEDLPLHIKRIRATL